MSKIFSALFNLSNPGTKIKKFAKTIYIIEVIFAVVTAMLAVVAATIILFTREMEFSEGLIALAAIFVLGFCLVVLVFFAVSIGSWLPTILLYGFGEIVESLDVIETDKSKKESKSNTSRSEVHNSKSPNNDQKNDFDTCLTSKGFTVNERVVEKNNISITMLDGFIPKSANTFHDTTSAEEGTSYENNVAILKESLMNELTYALSLETLDGMISYLKNIDDERIQKIITEPRITIRELVSEYLGELYYN